VERPAVARRFARFVEVVAQRFYADNCLRHASALAYTTLLSLVPLFALMFAVLKGLGVQRRLEPLLLSRLALNADVVDQIIGYIDKTNVGALGAAALLLTVLSVLGSVEATFNDIWRVRRGRTWLRKASDYLSVVMIAPMLLLAAVAITSSVQEQRILQMLFQTEYVGPALLRALRLAPIVFNAATLAILYAIMPNRRPNAAAVLLGAVVAGAAWQLVQWTYVAFQIGVAQYNAIYGAAAQLPITLAWIYVSWAVVLAGAEIAAVYEHGADEAVDSVSRRAIALEILVRACERLKSGGEPVVPARIGRELGADADCVVEVFEALAKDGWIVPVEGEDGYVLNREPAAVQLSSMTDVVGGDAIPASAHPQVQHALAEIAERERATWTGMTLADLMAQERARTDSR
jgi:membrane protein